MPNQLTLSFDRDASSRRVHTDADGFIAELRTFDGEGNRTEAHTTMAAFDGRSVAVPLLVNEFWTKRQRAAHSLHEISYRACFKPQLPRFFIERLTVPGATVYDPFSGRGTTALEAALLGRIPSACDVNPLSRILLAPRLDPPALPEIAARLASIPLKLSPKTNLDSLGAKIVAAGLTPTTTSEASAIARVASPSRSGATPWYVVTIPISGRFASWRAMASRCIR